MSIMQIGELSIKLSDDFKEYSREKVAWDLIKGMRNLFVHVYATMDKDIIWETAKKDIPALLIFCEDTLAEEHRG